MEADEEEVYTVHGTEHEYTEVDFIGAEVDSHESEVHAAEPEKPHDAKPQLRFEHELHDAEPQQQAQQELYAAEQEAQAAEHDVEAEVQPAEIDVHASGPQQQAQQELHVVEQEAQAAEHELHDAEPEVQVAETDVEFGEGPELDDEYEEGILGGEFTDSEYEQEENIAVEDNDENTYFRLSEGFDIGASGEQEGVRDVQEGEAPAGEASGTEYENSSELRILPSDTEAEGSSARRKNVCWFNPATDMEDLQFKLGMKFDNIKILRNAVVQYLVKNFRQLRYVKNMRTQLRVRCQDICPWVLYAYQQPDKSLRINTFVDEHTCTMVWQNRRVNSGFLSANTVPGKGKLMVELILSFI
ncbi:paternally-expressed gene 3 protein-like [Olea europaea var. sylvestris]|uniref:paternally-expressed gene 3 protein-like n=1 Tax=Olea europaea var. sylvestris TaxID=158386 RepID=UPI000C1CD4A9|nr:paternally-expressed gene 3 protein-like [Olea europaea var. sylvestris]